jgi:hypothetical protein
MVLFHSLANSRSVLLFHRDSSSPFRPHFSLTPSSPTTSTSCVPTPINDFTPSQIATSTAIYAVELTETSLVPSLLEEIDSISPSLNLEDKFFVGPWKDDRLSLEDIATSLVMQRKKRRSSEGSTGGGESEESTTNEGFRFRYRGQEKKKENEEIWARKWKSATTRE